MRAADTLVAAGTQHGAILTAGAPTAAGDALLWFARLILMVAGAAFIAYLLLIVSLVVAGRLRAGRAELRRTTDGEAGGRP